MLCDVPGRERLLGADEPWALARRKLAAFELGKLERPADVLVQVEPYAVWVREKDLDHLWIKLRAAIAANFFARGGDRQSLSIRSVGNHCV